MARRCCYPSSGGETTEAGGRFSTIFSRTMRKPDLLIIDSGAGLARALAAVWVQCCTVHKHRNLLGTPRPAP